MAVSAERLAAAPPKGEFYFWRNPRPEQLGENAREFLQRLPGPTHIHLSGQDGSRCRAMATLLHGNEPSGLHAVFHVLKEGIRPLTDLHIFIPSVYAARQGPGFVYRMLPEQKDLNRCFKPPFDDSEEDQLALTLLNSLKRLQPECLIDVHNTSGSSPSFGVTTFMDGQHDALVSLFTHRMIVTDITLGALMEISDTLCPTVTIECGGAGDESSNLMAIEGLKRYMLHENVLGATHERMTLEFFHNPVRLELREGAEIAFGDRRLLDRGVTLVANIEDYNFGHVGEEVLLGFSSHPLETQLSARNHRDEECLQQYFRQEGEQFYPACRLKLFMVTTNPEIARRDCLFYLVPAD